MKEATLIGLVTLITESGDELVIDAYTDIDKANEVVVDLSEKDGPHYYVQYVELH